MQSGTLQKEDMSYRLYKDLADDLCSPIDSTLELQVRLELYESKLVYLRNLYAQAFREINGLESGKRFCETNESQLGDGFCGDDLIRIRQFLTVTEDFMRRDCLEFVARGLNKASERRASQVA